MVYNEVNPKIWIPENKEDCIEGVLLTAESDVGVNKSMLYSLENKTGIISFWGATILDSRMKLLKIGDKIKITYKGLGPAKGGHNAPKIFKVEVDQEPKDDVVPV